MTTCPSRGTREIPSINWRESPTTENGCCNPMTGLLECIGEDCCYHFKFLNLIDTMTKRLENNNER